MQPADRQSLPCRGGILGHAGGRSSRDAGAIASRRATCGSALLDVRAAGARHILCSTPTTPPLPSEGSRETAQPTDHTLTPLGVHRCASSPSWVHLHLEEGPLVFYTCMLHGTGRSEKLHRPRFSTIWEAAGASRAGAQPEDVSANIGHRTKKS